MDYVADPEGGMKEKGAAAPQQPAPVAEQPKVEETSEGSQTVAASPEERAALAAQAQADADAAEGVAATARKTADELNAALNEESTEDEIAAAKTAEQNAVEAEAVVEGLKANAGVGTD